MGAARWVRVRAGPSDDTTFLGTWLLAVATYGVGDGLTTFVLMRHAPAIREVNGLLVAAVDGVGPAGIVGVKLAALCACLALSVHVARDDDPSTAYVPPAVLSLIGAVATASNLGLLLG